MHNTPWLGLASYMEQNSDSFFGRSAEIQELFFKIYDNIATIVYGTSGTGKTSLLRAGIFPKLREKQFLPIYLRLTHDRNSLPYKEQIFSAIRQELQENCCSIKEISPLPANAEETLWSYLHRYEITDGRNCAACAGI